MKNIVIAIDGPVCSGKGTLSIALAKKLDILYLYTGGMYRALALACNRAGIDLDNEEEVLRILNSANLDLHVSAGETKLFLGEEDVTSEIFEPEVSNQTPRVARHPRVREEMVKRQQKITEGQSAVIEGRDIASKVAPDADLKIHLTADVEVRAKRRLSQYQEKGIKKTFEQVLEETKERDRIDSEREASPLSIQDDSVIIDTTNDSTSDTVEKVLNILHEKDLYD